MLIYYSVFDNIKNKIIYYIQIINNYSILFFSDSGGMASPNNGIEYQN